MTTMQEATNLSPTGLGTTLVLGGTGKTGKSVADRLRARDLPVRVASRSGDVPFDWEDQSTWAPALRGASSAYVSFYPDLAVPGAPEAIATFTQQALANDVRRLVLLSGRGEEEAQRAEGILQASGADWTIVRVAAGSARTSARAISSSRCSAASSPCPAVTRPSPSSTPTTSPTWRWRRSLRKATRASFTS